MRNIVRQPVTGDDFFERPKLIKKIRKALDAKLSILLSGTIKSGKTSTLFYLRDNLSEHYHFIYLDAGTISHVIEYFDTLYDKIGELDNFKGFHKELDEPAEIEDIVELLSHPRDERPLVIMIDNFPGIPEDSPKNKAYEKAGTLLEFNRELRLAVEANMRNARFIYTPCLHLEFIAGSLDLGSSINDLYLIDIPPLSGSEAKEFIERVSQNAEFSIDTIFISDLCEEIEWLNPFQVQLLIYETDRIFMDEAPDYVAFPSITDETMKQVLKHKDYFQRWESGLPGLIDSKDYEFAKDLLNALSGRDKIHLVEIGEKARRWGVHDYFKSIIDSLVQYNYLQKDETSDTYRFNSPLIKAYWQEQVAKITGKVPVREKKEVKKDFKAFKIQRIGIKHIKCFEDIEINFDSSSNTALLIGTNGKGKSTILQLIGLGLSGVSNVPFTYNWKEVVKKNHDHGLFEIDGHYDNKPIHLKFRIDGKDDSIACTKGKNSLHAMRDAFILLAYGVNRSYKLEETKPYKDIESIATLFGENGYLKHIKISSTYEYVNRNFETIQVLVNKVLEQANGDSKVVLTGYDSNGFYFKTPSNPGQVIPIEALSEGFKSTLVWLFDAIIRIVEAGGSLENAADVTGMILLDEIDLHLHPSWQRTILQSVETLFPNIQFIVSSHSPFVVQGALEDCLIALEMEKESGNVVVVDKDMTSELSYSAIVREIFNIQFPFNSKIEQKMDEFREMANALRDKKPVDEEKFKKLVEEISGKGVELEGIMRRELLTLKRRTGKIFDLWKK